MAEALAAGHNAVIPVLPVTDTIKEVGRRHRRRHPARDALAAVQDPQGFDKTLLLDAFAHAGPDFTVTDDASLVEHLGQPALTVAGTPENMKITHPQDLARLAPTASQPRPGRPWLRRAPLRRSEPGPGQTAPARPMKLGGFPILGAPDVLAHSDGDAAPCPDRRGCVVCGDIGRLFPDSNPDFDNMASGVFVSEALLLAKARGLTITHVDLTIIAQIPKISPHAEAIRVNAAALLGLDKAHVNLKATTEEGLGFTGEKGISCRPGRLAA